ncbi:MAG TPA: LPP20 family lipoprotein [Bacteroidota bacterium]
MKTVIVRTLMAAVLAVGGSSVLPGQVPEWYSTHKNPRYPAELYILGVCAGNGARAIEAATKAAQMDVVSQIRVQIQAQVRNVSESFQFDKDEQIVSDFRSNIRTAVSDEIAGMETVETVTDNASGTAYAFVVLDRDKYCESIRNEMDAGWKQATDLRTASTSYARKGRLNDAVQNLLESRKVIAPLLTKQALYNSVSNSPYKPAASFGPTTISSDIRSLLSNVTLEKIGGDKQRGKIGRKFADPFVVRVSFNVDSSAVPVVGATVVFETSDGITVGDATTDERGLASLSTTVRAMKGNGIRARLSLQNAGREFEQNLLSSAVNFTWKAESPDVSFMLTIDASSTKASANLRNAFTSAITQVGYKVVKSSRFVLQIEAETGQSTKVEGMSGTMYSVDASVSATLVDKESNTTLGSAKFSGKGLARSESEALQKAVANVKIGQNDISDLLEKALQD